MHEPLPVDFAALRRRLATRRGRDYWQSLEELAASPGFQDALARQAPAHAAALAAAVDRRDFLRLMGASLALGGLTACTRQPEERIVPYVRQPEQLVLGEPLFFATAMPLAGIATGLLVESHEGHPTKIEGNPQHPASLGATDALTQAAILGLYDPDRSQTILAAGEIRPWSAFVEALRKALEAQRPGRGAGLRLLTETVTAPALAHQIRDLLRAFPAARWHQWEPVGRDGARLGARLAFGEFVETRHHIERADVILALDADFLTSGPGVVRHAREFARRRRPGDEMNRLYVVEPMPTPTGSVADHRLPLRAMHVEAFARTVAAALGVRGRADAPVLEEHQAFAAAVARDLQRRRGSGLVIAGEGQPPQVHALAHAMNQALGNVGRTVEYTDPVEAEPTDQLGSLRDLVEDMARGRVEVLLMLGANPVLTAPADLRFRERLDRVGLRVHLGLYRDETAVVSHWHVNEAHFLEAWGDARAFDGTVSILQPLIAPLYGGRTAYEVLAAASDRPERTAYDVVREYWRGQLPGADAEAAWRKVLHDGIVPGTVTEARRVVLRADWDRAPERFAGQLQGDLELVFRSDPNVFDGRFANNGWLQELPRPLTKLTWDNAAHIAPATAERLGLQSGDVVELRYRARALRAPVWVLPGHAEDTVTVHLGYGRTQGGRVAAGVGFDVYPLRTSEAVHFGLGLAVLRTAARHAFACTQDHFRMEGRPLVRTATLEEYRRDPHFAHAGGHDAGPADSLYPPHPYPGHAWGMAVDLGACIGCNACVVACVAENNIAVVGKDQVARGREMHWIRIDRYWTGDLDNPETLTQPVLCQHCENAPCEVVCPVNATVHSSEGLNDMVYNRCVGTRYCSNNCPYKVRRFNFYLYSDWTTETFKLARNPDVTVRSRGVMEKCTYCVQRIEHARAQAITEGRPIRDGDVVTACQQACPSEAIVFGDVNDPASRVAELKRAPRNYGLLADLNTRPRTTYLAGVRNPNPELTGGTA